MKKSVPIEKINAIAELDRIGYKWVPKTDEEIGVCCPVHNDDNPSASINTKKNLWRCHAAGCNAKGDIIHFMAHALKVDRSTVFSDLCDRYELQEVKAISQRIVEEYHEEIWSSGPLLKALRDRGVTDEEIRYARLGFKDGRITIPVFDEDRRVLNIRRYLPGAPGPEKMLNMKGYGQPRLYQIEQMKHEKVWICGGEMKALVVGGRLGKYGVGAVAVTAGEGAWEHQFSKLFRGKKVYICMDIDAGGKSAAMKIASILTGVAAELHVIRLPLDKTKFPKGDVNDYVGKCGANDTDLLKLMEASEEFVADTAEPEDATIIETKLSSAARAENIGKNVAVEAVVQAIDDTPFIVPKIVGVGCTKDQPNCDHCPVFTKDQDEKTSRVEMTVKGTAMGVLSMINSPSAKQRDAMMESLKIPSCKVASFVVREHYNAFDVRLAPQLTISGSNSDHVSQASYILSESNIELNTPYKFTGRVHPHPKNQQAILLIDNIASAKDSLGEFSCSADDYRTLEVFAADDIQAKLDLIYKDLESNVTRIYHRRDLHLMIDLTFYSPLYFYFDGHVHKGWANTVIVGDSSQGKSETTLRLMEHYGLGERVDCKNASVAGLLGGLSQLGTRWMVSWGLIPTHDRRLVVLEEVKGAPIEILARLTDMRSSGIAEIPKIEKRRAHARTRLIFISNPRSNRPIKSYNFGCETIPELIGGLEDVRRFDAALVVSSDQVDSEEINKLTASRPTHPHVLTAELCRLLTLWSWTRKPEQVRFDRQAELVCYEEANRLCGKFTDALPLLDKGTTHLKLARLSAALAARLFSHDAGDSSILVVKTDHVKYVAKWLEKIYSDPVFGYEDFTKAVRFTSTVSDPEVVEKTILSTKFPSDFVTHLLHGDQINLTDIADWCDVDRDEAQKVLSTLVRKHALYRQRKWYVKSSEFIDLLKRMRSRGSLKTTPEKGAEF